MQALKFETFPIKGNWEWTKMQFLISLKERHGPLAGGEAAVEFAEVRPVQTGGGPRVGRRGAG